MKNLRIIFVLIAIGFAIGSTASCKKDMTEPPDPGLANCPDTISFVGTVEPIIQQSCSTTGCHDAGAGGGYNLLGYTNISSNISIILEAINHNSGVQAMPFFGDKLADSTIQKVICWNLQGALDN